MAQQQFPIENDRHTYQQALSRLGILAAFWAFATLLMLKKDEWEWWQTLASRFKMR
jgi:hypothetical protein